MAPSPLDRAYLTSSIKDEEGEEAAVAKIEELANAPVNSRTAAPFIALQGFFAGDEKTRDKAVGFAKKAVERAPQDPLALLCLSALYGQTGKIDEAIKLLAPQEALMLKDVRLAHNYFQALFQSRDMPRITALLNKLATSPVREVKQFAIDSSRAVSQILAQQQAALAQAAPSRRVTSGSSRGAIATSLSCARSGSGRASSPRPPSRPPTTRPRLRACPPGGAAATTDPGPSC